MIFILGALFRFSVITVLLAYVVDQIHDFHDGISIAIAVGLIFLFLLFTRKSVKDTEGPWSTFMGTVVILFGLIFLIQIVRWSFGI